MNQCRHENLIKCAYIKKEQLWKLGYMGSFIWKNVGPFAILSIKLIHNISKAKLF